MRIVNNCINVVYGYNVPKNTSNENAQLNSTLNLSGPTEVEVPAPVGATEEFPEWWLHAAGAPAGSEPSTGVAEEPTASNEEEGDIYATPAENFFILGGVNFTPISFSPSVLSTSNSSHTSEEMEKIIEDLESQEEELEHSTQKNDSQTDLKTEEEKESEEQDWTDALFEKAMKVQAEGKTAGGFKKKLFSTN